MRVDSHIHFWCFNADEYPWIGAVIGWVDLRDEKLTQRLDRWASAGNW